MWLTQLTQELRRLDSVETVEITGDVVGFDVDRGEYDSLSSEVISTLGRYDCELYTFPDEDYKYRVIES